MLCQKKNYTISVSGFTLVELMLVIAIIGIISAISVPQFIQYRKGAFVAMINSDCRNAFVISTVFLADNPSANNITLADLTNNGFRSSSNVTTNGSAIVNNNYTITSTGTGFWGLSDPVATLTAFGIWDGAHP